MAGNWGGSGEGGQPGPLREEPPPRSQAAAVRCCCLQACLPLWKPAVMSKPHSCNGPDRVSAPHGCPGLKGPLAPGEGSWKPRGTARGFWGAWEVLSGWRRVLSCTDGLRPHLSSTSRARGSEGYPEAAFWNLQHLQMQEPPINETKPASRMARRHHF